MKLYRSTHKKKTNPKLPGDCKYFLDLVFTLPPNLSEAVSHFGNVACFIVFHAVPNGPLQAEAKVPLSHDDQNIESKSPLGLPHQG
jgi:hypothetical protein